MAKRPKIHKSLLRTKTDHQLQDWRLERKVAKLHACYMALVKLLNDEMKKQGRG